MPPTSTGALVLDTHGPKGSDVLPRDSSEIPSFLEDNIYSYQLLLGFPDAPDSVAAASYPELHSFLERKDIPSLAVFAVPTDLVTQHDPSSPPWPPLLPDTCAFIRGERAGFSAPPEADNYQAVISMLWHMFDLSESPLLDADETVEMRARRFLNYIKGYAEVLRPRQAPSLTGDFLVCAKEFTSYLLLAAPRETVCFDSWFTRLPFEPLATAPATGKVFSGMLNPSSASRILVLPVRSPTLSTRSKASVARLGKAVLGCLSEKTIRAEDLDTPLIRGAEAFRWGDAELKLPKMSMLMLEVLSLQPCEWVSGTHLKNENVSNPSKAADGIERALRQAGCANPRDYIQRDPKDGFRWNSRKIRRIGKARSRHNPLPDNPSISIE